MLTVAGGARSGNIARALCGGPGVTQTEAHRLKHRFVLVPGNRSADCDINVKNVGDLYARLMKERDIPPGSVCFIAATDLTVITPALSMMGNMTHAIGVCGPRASVDAAHDCDFHFIDVPDGKDGHRVLINAFDNFVKSHCKSFLTVFRCYFYGLCSCSCTSVLIIVLQIWRSTSSSLFMTIYRQWSCS